MQRESSEMYFNREVKSTGGARWRMIRTLQRINGFLILGVVLAISGSAMIGGCEYFPESTFKLANESRLPKWITLPSGLTRADVSITMNYYVKPWGSSARFILQDSKKQVLEKAEGKVRCKEPFQLNNHPQGFASGYPSYEVITVNGMNEIIEHRKMEPIFYITDDAAVWKQYSARGCG
jgi:hypothetical protein